MCRPALTYKLEPYSNILNCTPNERYEMLETAKDQVVEIAWSNRSDKRWGYANWVKITQLIRGNDYESIVPIVKEQRAGKSRTLMLQYLDDIIALERSEY